ncbi:hypothetical protein Lal_00037942, partial [Lupinus albus]
SNKLEVKEALKRIEKDKTVGPDNISTHELKIWERVDHRRYILATMVDGKILKEPKGFAYENAYDKIPRKVLWNDLEKKGIHQGSTLSPNLFALVLNVLIEHIKEPMPQYILSADDIILRDELNGKLELWRQALEAHRFHISRSKTKYMECKFSKRRTNSTIEENIGDNIIPQVTRFKKKVGVALIVEKIIESRLRLFLNMWKILIEALIRGRPRKNTLKMIKKILDLNVLSMNMIYN